MELTPLLIDAKSMYTNQLADALAPFVYKTVVGMYQEVNGSNPKFQEKLRQVPTWNSVTITQHVSEIKTARPYIQDLISAVMVAHVKVLSSVRVRTDKPNIRLRLPDTNEFVHNVFINAAKDYFSNPGLLGQQTTPRAVHISIVRSAVDTSVRDMLPLAELLKAYIGTSVDDDQTMTPLPDEIDAPVASDDEQEQQEQVWEPSQMDNQMQGQMDNQMQGQDVQQQQQYGMVQQQPMMMMQAQPVMMQPQVFQPQVQVQTSGPVPFLSGAPPQPVMPLGAPAPVPEETKHIDLNGGRHDALFSDAEDGEFD